MEKTLRKLTVAHFWTVYGDLNCHTITMAAGMTRMSLKIIKVELLFVQDSFLDSFKADHPLQVRADYVVTLKSLQTPRTIKHSQPIYHKYIYKE